jgi:DNA-binding transcriptional LysR family regulator
MELDVRRLFLLAEIAEHGSLTGAAEAMMYTTSAVSQQMRRLEAEADQTLFERHARGVVLTDAGAALVARAQAIRRELAGAQSDLEALSGLRAGSLRIGSFPTASASILPLVLTQFAREHPAVAVSVKSALRDPLRELLLMREVELALLWEYDWSPFTDEEIETEKLVDDPTVLVVASGSEVGRSGPVDLSSLAAARWIIRADGHPVADVLTRSCHAAGFAPDIAYDAHDYQEAQAMVAAGLGVALAPRLSLTNLRDDVRLVPLDPRIPVPVRRILLGQLKGRKPTPAMLGFRATLRAAAQAMPRAFGRPGQLGSVNL